MMNQILKGKSSSQSFFKRLFGPILRWLTPGLGVKRWLLLILLGTTLLGIGLGVLILDVYRNAPDTWWLPLLSVASLRFLDRSVRALIFGILGAGFVIGGIWGLNRSLLAPFRRSGKAVLDQLEVHRRLERGPRVVALGGGHGLATLLRGFKSYSYNITAVVTVADDGGSSGRLRQTMGILPPGDIRNCLAALSNDETLLSQLFQYRFASGDGQLEGHAFGNLFISALAEITGSFEEAVAESGRVLAVHGRVLPATIREVRLVADVVLPHSISEVRVAGESHIPEISGQVHRVWLEPDNPPAYPQVIQALLAADLIMIGPGSLFTSILPNLLVPDIASCLRNSKALKMFVCNLTTQAGETDGFTCGDHVRAILDHSGDGLFDIVLANNQYEGQLPPNTEWVRVEEDRAVEYSLYLANFIDPQNPGQHDAHKLAQVIMDLYQERTGPLIE